MVELLRGPVTRPQYLSVEDVQSLPNVVDEVLGGIVGLQEEETSKTTRHPISMQTRAASSLGCPPSYILARMGNTETQICLGAPSLHTNPTALRLSMAGTPFFYTGSTLPPAWSDGKLWIRFLSTRCRAAAKA